MLLSEVEEKVTLPMFNNFIAGMVPIAEAARIVGCEIYQLKRVEKKFKKQLPRYEEIAAYWINYDNFKKWESKGYSNHDIAIRTHLKLSDINSAIKKYKLNIKIIKNRENLFLSNLTPGQKLAMLSKW